MGTEQQYSRQGSQAKPKYIDRTLREDKTGEGKRQKAEGRVPIYSSGTLVPMAFQQLFEVQGKVISHFLLSVL